jgi:uncharacterized RDD family membrane protein YckC
MEAETQQPVVAAPRPRPWVRYWARSLDTGLIMLVIHLIAPPWSELQRSRWGGVATAWLIYVLLLAVETVLLATWGSTPGKAILGVQVEPEGGGKLGWRQALVRALNVWWRGDGAGVPFVSFITRLIAYDRLDKEGSTAWDRLAGTRVRHRPVAWWRVALYVLALVATYLAYGALRERTPPVSWREVSGEGYAVQIPYFEHDPRGELGTQQFGAGGHQYLQFLHAPNFSSES